MVPASRLAVRSSFDRAKERVPTRVGRVGSASSASTRIVRHTSADPNQLVKPIRPLFARPKCLAINDILVPECSGGCSKLPHHRLVLVRVGGKDPSVRQRPRFDDRRYLAAGRRPFLDGDCQAHLSKYDVVGKHPHSASCHSIDTVVPDDEHRLMQFVLPPKRNALRIADPVVNPAFDRDHPPMTYIDAGVLSDAVVLVGVGSQQRAS